jgi:hypothetical protein
MMERLHGIDAMSSNDEYNLDNGDDLDLNLDDPGVEFDSGDFETLLSEESKLTSLNFEDQELEDLMMAEEPAAVDQELQDLMAEEPAVVDNMPRPLGARGESGVSDGLDPLENMPFNEVFEENEILGDFLKETEGSELANNRDPLQRMLDQVLENESVPNSPPNVLSSPPLMDTARLEAEKQHLLNQLEQLKQQNQMTNNQRNMNMAQNNQFVQQEMQQQQNSFSAPQKNYFAALPKSSFVASVASVKTAGSTGETPLQSFLRSGRRSMNEIQQMPQQSSLNQTDFPGAPSAASVFSHMPMELDAINSQSELFASNSFVGSRTNPRKKLYGSMDRTAATQDLLIRKMSGNDIVQNGSGANLLNRPGSGRNLASGSGANASWGVGRSASGGAYKSSGMLPKQASESHLLRAASIPASLPAKSNGLSRENLRYGLLKKPGSRGNLGSSGNLNRSDSFSSRMTPKRRSGPNIKHKLDASQSVPHLMQHASINSNRQSSAGGFQGNAKW